MKNVIWEKSFDGDSRFFYIYWSDGGLGFYDTKQDYYLLHFVGRYAYSWVAKIAAWWDHLKVIL